MKKTVFYSLLCAVMLSLTSCQVNWFGKTVETPWYCIAIPVTVIFVLGYIILMSKTYICPHCNTEFKAKPHQLYVTVHMNGKRLAKCPSCKMKSFCRIKR